MVMVNQGTIAVKADKSPSPIGENFKEKEVRVALLETRDYDCTIKERKSSGNVMNDLFAD